MTVEYMGFEIAPYDEDGVWYAKVQKIDKTVLTAGIGRSNKVLSNMPANSESEAVETAKNLISSGVISN